ncbi:CopG family transcriptional regulator [Nostoc sp. UIC 10607]|uniref:ribbon-helix-helix domain-containing protein n=1 Tax=Nostoc sp. UIC 10607 TaxID=3045935 RepID=UPI00399FD324
MIKTTAKFSMRFTEETKVQIEKLAADRESSIAQIVREALRDYLAKQTIETK